MTSSSSSIPNPNHELNQAKLRRLHELVEAVKGQSQLGIMLGHRDGSAVGQILRGDRPLTDKFIQAVHNLPGYAGWFDGLLSSVKLLPTVPLLEWHEVYAFLNGILPNVAERTRLTCPVDCGSQGFCVKVEYEGMRNFDGEGFSPESIIFVNPSATNVASGDFVIAMVNGAEVPVFRQYFNEKGYERLAILNPCFPQTEVMFKVMGKVEGVWTPLPRSRNV